MQNKNNACRVLGGEPAPADTQKKSGCAAPEFVDKSSDFQRRTLMTLAHWLPFAIASAILVAIPGPTVLLVISYALGHGRRFAMVTTAGVALGDLTSITASM